MSEYCSYENYLQERKAIAFEAMNDLHQQILSEIWGDPDAAELYDELIRTSIRYLYFRSNWAIWNVAEKAEQDPGRTRCHDSVIVKCNMLARYLRMQGKPAQWRDVLGDPEEDLYNRKAIGDFACYLAFVHAIHSR